ncbi:MAG: TRAM domain-containing protein [Gemmatimonadetes bacterium]|nr:TRAM domain-containing protein [Gemmatimonadota bacterium]
MSAPPPEPGPVDVSVRAIAAGGAGVADLPDGRVVFVHRTAPGDRARVRVTRSKRSWARAELVTLLEPGPGRREAPCPHYARCGGCTLEHLEYAEQLRWKGRLVSDALQRIGGVEAEPPAVAASPRELRYRNRVTFTLKRLGRGRVVAGFHELENPGRIVDMGGGCLLPEEVVADAWDGLRGAWGSGAGRLPAGRVLRLTLRAVGGGVVLVVGGGRGRGDPEALLEAVDGLRAVWHDADGGPPELLAGDRDTREAWLGESFPVGASAFLQVNRGAAELLHEAAIAAVEARPGDAVVDGYCGVGVYGRTLARDGARVTGIELDPEAAAAARAGAPAGFRVLEGAVEARLPEALPADRVILNPPRTGLHEDVPARLVGSGVERLVYVSCDPATLARDAARLSARFGLDALRAFDLFPQTAHVETLAVFVAHGGGHGD